MLTVLLGAGLLWAALVALLFWQKDRLLYPFDRQPAAPRTLAEAVLPGSAGAPDLPVWIAHPAPGKPVIVYFMGNGGSLAFFEERLERFADAGFGVAALAYRGGGGAPGRPSEAVLKADALRLWHRLGDVLDRRVAERPVIWGTSLGAGIGAWVAERTDPAAVVLESPFTRLCEAARWHYPWAPACTVLGRDAYATLDLVPRIDAPVLVIHGGRDAVIPAEHGARVAQAARRGAFRLYPDAGHATLGLHGAVEDALAFVARTDADTDPPRK